MSVIRVEREFVGGPMDGERRAVDALALTFELPPRAAPNPDAAGVNAPPPRVGRYVLLRHRTGDFVFAWAAEP